MRKWKDDLPEVRRLAEQEKLHAAEIGRALGATKNAIIGLCRRNGIKLHYASGNLVGRRGPASGAERTRRWKERKAASTAAPKVAFVRAHQPLPSVIRMAAIGVRFGDLQILSPARANQCRNFLPGESGVDGLVCAAETPIGEPWCNTCRGRIYTKLRATPRQRFGLGQWTLGADAAGETA